MKNLKDRPFAILGVNIVAQPPKKLKAVMMKENITWRSFADAGDAVGTGSIATKWNLSATPTLYIIDHKGIIRHKWVGSPGEMVIDGALEKLIKEAEGKKKPRS